MIDDKETDMTARKNPISTTLQCSALVALALSGCATESARYPGYDDWDDPSGDPRGEVEEGMIPIDQTISVGSFVLDLSAVRFGEVEGLLGPEPFVAIDFAAHNLSASLQSPLASLGGDGLLLELGGGYYYGEVDAETVPGLRDGVGSVVWYTYPDRVTRDALEEAIVTFGYAAQNQAVVPLSSLGDTISLRGIELEIPATIQSYRYTTVEFGSAWVHFSDVGDNELAPAGLAYLVLEAELNADVDMHNAGEYWGEANVVLTRPDGVSLTVESLNEAIYPGDRQDVVLAFEITQPASGSYLLEVTEPGLTPVTRTIVVP